MLNTDSAVLSAAELVLDVSETFKVVIPQGWRLEGLGVLSGSEM